MTIHPIPILTIDQENTAMTNKKVKELATRALVFTGGTIRLALAGIGASMAAFLMIDKLRRRQRSKHDLPYEKIKKALRK